MALAKKNKSRDSLARSFSLRQKGFFLTGWFTKKNI